MNKSIIFVLIFAMVINVLTARVFANSNVPETLKIGLYFSSTARSEYSVKASGISIFAGNDDDRSKVLSDGEVTQVTVKKDIYYHARIDESFASYDDAWILKNQLKQDGYESFVGYEDGRFTVFAGQFSSFSEAENTAKKINNSYVGEVSSNRTILYISGTPWLSVEEKNMHLEIEPVSDYISIEGKPYRGCLRFVRQSGSDMTAINIVGTEEYLYGVVPREMSASWPTEALKAQAVAARCYAVTNLSKYVNLGFNLCDTIQSQVYGGVNAENQASNKAVDETAGELVMYEGKPCSTFFFASSGGVTEDNENVWNGTPIAYLRAVKDPYENADEATYGKWTFSFSPEQIKAKLAEKQIDIGDIVNMEAQYSQNGRAVKLTIIGTNGTKEYLRDSIRGALGLYSTNFKLTREGGETPIAYVIDGERYITQINLESNKTVISSSNVTTLPTELTLLSKGGTTIISRTPVVTSENNFILSGGGWGHGIGMSQWGAKGMAENGYDYIDILTHYYKGTKVY